MKTIHHTETFKSRNLHADFESNRWAHDGSPSALNYTERFGESADGIPVLVLSVKGLISSSWFEERNRFCVCTSLCVCVCVSSLPWWALMLEAISKHERGEMKRFPHWDHSQMCACACVCVFRLGDPAHMYVIERETTLRHWTPTVILMSNKASSFFSHQ